MKTIIIYIIVPLILTNVFHMLVVKKNLFSHINIAISNKLFGNNKTWRGFVLVPLLNSIFQMALNQVIPLFNRTEEALAFGALLGFTYVLFELPNSWLKRTIGIPSGEKSHKFPGLFLLIDKCDSALGISIVCMFIFSLTLGQASSLFLASVLSHILFSLLLVFLHIKKKY